MELMQIFPSRLMEKTRDDLKCALFRYLQALREMAMILLFSPAAAPLVQWGS